MSSRALAFLLAVLMLWSGLAVTEQRFAEALDLPEQSAGATADPKRSALQGSMDDHVVDDQPAQPFGGPALESAALIDTWGTNAFRTAERADRPSPPPIARWTAPYQEGLRRPPKTA
jgi:hypothetical protein